MQTASCPLQAGRAQQSLPCCDYAACLLLFSTPSHKVLHPWISVCNVWLQIYAYCTVCRWLLQMICWWQKVFWWARVLRTPSRQSSLTWVKPLLYEINKWKDSIRHCHFMLAVQVCTNREWKAFKDGQRYAKKQHCYKMNNELQSTLIGSSCPIVYYITAAQKQKASTPWAMFEAHPKTSKQKAINNSSRQNP